MAAGSIISRMAERVTMSTRRAVLGLVGALHDAGDLAELAAHLFDHLAAGAADGLHAQAGEQVGQQAADQQADQHPGLVDAGRG